MSFLSKRRFPSARSIGRAAALLMMLAGTTFAGMENCRCGAKYDGDTFVVCPTCSTPSKAVSKLTDKQLQEWLDKNSYAYDCGKQSCTNEIPLHFDKCACNHPRSKSDTMRYNRYKAYKGMLDIRGYKNRTICPNMVKCKGKEIPCKAMIPKNSNVCPVCHGEINYQKTAAPAGAGSQIFEMKRESIKPPAVKTSVSDWQCSACSFINKDKDDACQMCKVSSKTLHPCPDCGDFTYIRPDEISQFVCMKSKCRKKRIRKREASAILPKAVPHSSSSGAGKIYTSASPAKQAPSAAAGAGASAACQTDTSPRRRKRKRSTKLKTKGWICKCQPMILVANISETQYQPKCLNCGTHVKDPDTRLYNTKGLNENQLDLVWGYRVKRGRRLTTVERILKEEKRIMNS